VFNEPFNDVFNGPLKKVLDMKCREVVQMGRREGVTDAVVSVHNSPRVSPARVVLLDKGTNDHTRKPEAAQVSRLGPFHLVTAWSTDGRRDIDRKHTYRTMRGTPQAGALHGRSVRCECYRKGAAKYSPEDVSRTGAAGGVNPSQGTCNRQRTRALSGRIAAEVPPRALTQGWENCGRINQSG
jgi:hypothetical protein